MAYTYKYERPSITVDCVVFGLDERELRIMLIKRGAEPFKNRWALPGGFIHMDETLEKAAVRELKEETGIEKIFLEQLYTFGDVNRDPRGRVITVAYYALVNLFEHKITASTDAAKAAWFSIDDLPDLAFDHGKIIEAAERRLTNKVRYEPIGFELLPKKFTLTQLQNLYEIILEQKLDKRNFRKKILSMNLLISLDEVEEDVAHRAAKLYEFNKNRYDQLKKKGFNFEI